MSDWRDNGFVDPAAARRAAQKMARAGSLHHKPPAFWSDLEVRGRAIKWHRQMTVREALERMQCEIGRAPSKSALARFWQRLDKDDPSDPVCLRAKALASDFVFDIEARRKMSESMEPVRQQLRAAAHKVTLSKIEALVELIDHRIEVRGNAASPGLGQRITLRARDIYRRLRRALGHDFGGHDVAEQHHLDRSDVILELGEIIFGRRHLGSPSNGYADDEETIARRIRAHRLSETSK